MATVRLQISPKPAHVRTARLVTAAFARFSGLADGALDEIRLAVGEACSRAVGLHEEYAPGELITVLLQDDGQFVVTVCDSAPVGAQSGPADPLDFLADVDTGRQTGADQLPSGFGLAVINGLVDDLEISPAEDGPGTVVRMSWPRVVNGEGGRSTR